MRKLSVLPISVLMALTAVSCGWQSREQKDEGNDVHELEIVPKVKEPQTNVVDTVGFPEEATGTPITGYQGYPDDGLVKESKDDEIVDFAGEADLDYYSGGGSSDDY